MMILKRTLSYFLAIVIIAVICFSTGKTIEVSAESNVAKSNDSEQTVSESDTLKDSYTEYIKNYSEYGKEDIVYDLNGIILDTKPIEFEISAYSSGLYGIGMSYKSFDIGTSDICVGVKVDGKYPYRKAEEIEFARMWCDSADTHTDALGNEFSPQQIQFTEYRYSEAYDETLEYDEKYMIYLEAGNHHITLIPKDSKLAINYFKFVALNNTVQYSAPKSSEEFYDGERIVIECEDALVKSDYFLVGKTDTSSTLVTPHSADKNLINYIGGGNWKTIGDTIVWETPELNAGYYKIGFSFRQNSVIGGKTYRCLTIDGRVPFSEASKIGFEYGDTWQQKFLTDENNQPYLLYLSKGKHEIALTVTAGDIKKVRTQLTEAVDLMSELYIDITMITGETVDVYRDYNLFKQISDMQERLELIRSKLDEAAKALLEITGEKSGSNYSVINNMIEAINQMLNNKYEAHRYKSYYYSNYCSVSSVLQELSQMPLDIDKISLTSEKEQKPFEKTSFIEKIAFSVKRFVVSFTRDYNAVSDINSKGEKNVTVWVNWGRDQAQVLSSLTERSFTPKTGIKVNLKLVNATIIQATLSGNGPDVVLQHARSEPVNLAMRGVLYDLLQFDDCDKVLERFQKNAATPYMYKEGLYALPDTQTFFVMFYRKDILDEFGIKVPETWEEFDNAAKLLMRNKMSVYLPNNPATNISEINAGVGSNNIFPTLLLQNDISLYSEDGMSTNLLSSDTMEVFELWTDYYTKQKFPLSMDFYNRFRTGTTPLGIGAYTLYTTLKVAAPEIDGLWGLAKIPGTATENGSVSHKCTGGGTGCSILKNSKDVNSAWKFLKWWTDAETQLTYSNDVESILGPSGRIALSNVEAIKGLDWDNEMLDEILDAWQNVEEIPEYPGSYYVSRSIYQSFWNVVNANKNTKDMLLKYGKEANNEIARKWKQYLERN